jgi:surface antigen
MKKIMVLTGALLLAACGHQNVNLDLSTGKVAGASAGGLIGGLIGAQFGGGIGTILYTIAGIALGGAAGYTFGDSLLPSDHQVFQDRTKRAMANAGNGQVVSWTNPSTGVAGTITPVRSYYTGKGQVCRDFRATISAPEGIGQGTGMACKMAGGAWQILPPV